MDYTTTGGRSSCLLHCVSVVFFGRSVPFHFSHDDFRIFSVDFRILDFLSYFRINPDKSGWLAALLYLQSKKHFCSVRMPVNDRCYIPMSLPPAHHRYCTILSWIQALDTNTSVVSLAEGGFVWYMPSPFYAALFQLHGCVVSHMKMLATPLLNVDNIKHSFCWILTTESI